MSLTLISHIFNEEYLLPFWLEYHSKIFDNGIIIDYCSTDNTKQIITKFCPHWKIVNTRNVKPDGKPNFDADLIDQEVVDIEKTISGFKIALNVTEWFIFLGTKTELLSSLIKGEHYYLSPYQCMTTKSHFFPKNVEQFLNSIEQIKIINDRGVRILHDEPGLDYFCGRHGRLGNKNNVIRNDIVIMWTGYYPFNEQVVKRKLQIQQNIPLHDILAKRGSQHIVNYDACINNFKKELSLCDDLYQDKYSKIYNMINNALQLIDNNNIYYSELYVDCNWGEDKIILNNDINLLKKTDFDDVGYKIYNISNFNDLLKEFLKMQIQKIVGKEINLEMYHQEITEDEHKKILNSMPYKKEELCEFSNYITNFLSEELKEDLKIFNGDIWYRICRPTNVTENDNNPCHRDIYLDFYRNIVNIYLPIVGSNQISSLSIEPGSHKWNENMTMITNGGTTFKYINKKYSVDAIVSSKTKLNMLRPNPMIDQVMIFSPYLIHGCATNNNLDVTRISLEIRFIKNDENGSKQEDMFNDFLKIRDWR